MKLLVLKDLKIWILCKKTFPYSALDYTFKK
jgi:hypothetical protein